MPNHVHVLVHVWDWPLCNMVAAWKKFVAPKALAQLRAERRSPDRLDGSSYTVEPIRRSALQSFWQREYWDTFIRSEEQERTAIRYIESNPVKATLRRATEEWKFGSARFRDAYRNLVLPGAINHNLEEK